MDKFKILSKFHRKNSIVSSEHSYSWANKRWRTSAADAYSLNTIQCGILTHSQYKIHHFKLVYWTSYRKKANFCTANALKYRIEYLWAADVRQRLSAQL